MTAPGYPKINANASSNASFDSTPPNPATASASPSPAASPSNTTAISPCDPTPNEQLYPQPPQRSVTARRAGGRTRAALPCKTRRNAAPSEARKPSRLHGMPRMSPLSRSAARAAVVPDDLVVADTGEGQIVDRPTAACLQDLTGLVRPASGGRVLPPEVAARWAAPRRLLRRERGERLGIALTKRLCGGAKLIDHGRSMAQVDESSVSVRGDTQGLGEAPEDGARLGQCSGMTPELWEPPKSSRDASDGFRQTLATRLRVVRHWPVLDLVRDLRAVENREDSTRAACSPSVTVTSLTTMSSSAIIRCTSKLQRPVFVGYRD